MQTPTPTRGSTCHPVRRGREWDLAGPWASPMARGPSFTPNKKKSKSFKFHFQNYSRENLLGQANNTNKGQQQRPPHQSASYKPLYSNPGVVPAPSFRRTTSPPHRPHLITINPMLPTPHYSHPCLQQPLANLQSQVLNPLLIASLIDLGAVTRPGASS